MLFRSKLLEFNPNTIHLDCEIGIKSDEDYDAWFNTTGGDHDKYLYTIASDGMGGAFCLWSPRGLAEDQNPAVVYLGSEGEIGVAAENVDDFLMLLAGDYILNYLVFDGEKRHYKTVFDEGIEEIREDQQLYRNWLREVFGMEPDKQPAIMKRAKRVLTSFEDWFDERYIM